MRAAVPGFNAIKNLIRHPALYFGLPMIALLWLGILSQLATEREASHRAIVQDTANLTRLLEENVVRTITEIDRILQFLRHTYELSNYSADWVDLVNDVHLGSELTLQIAAIDAKGRLIATNLERTRPQPIDLADREHFKIHVDSSWDELYISTPVTGRRSNRWSIQFTRRYMDENANFAGVIVASLDPEHFARSYRSIDFGNGGTVTLIGLDGLVRASGGANPAPLGTDLSHTKLFEHIRTARSGTLRIGQEPSGDNQITSYRILRGFPIAVAVTADLYQPKSSYTRNLPVYLILGCILTVLIVLAILFSLGHSRRLEEARDALGASEAHLREKTRQLELTLTHMSQGIVMVGGDGQIPVVNPRCLELLGLPSDLLPPDGSSPSLNYRDVVAMLTRKGEFETEAIAPDILDYIIQSVGSEPVANYERTRPDGTVLEVRSNALPDGGFVRTFNDITSRRRNEARIAHLARHDPLTDLANRVLFREELDDAIVNLGAEGSSFALHLVDLDHFKVVNDSFGHPVGDQLLKAVARRLHEAVRRNDIIARLGGDEFAVLQMQVTSDLQAGHLADRICRIMARPFDIEGHTILVGASIGVALAPGDGAANQELLKAADLALYSAKAEGRGTYRYFKPEMNITLQARRRLDSELRTAIEQEQFLLHYQPIRDLDADCVTGYEALIRWRHPARGLVPPLEFIPAAEENGLIVPIGAWALRTALRDIANQPGTPRIAVNLSPIQLRSPDLINVVREALAESGLPAHRLELEITESALLDRTDVTLQQLKALNDLGVRIALDDFGTGYSSLSYLMSYPIDSIKIDRSFVARLGESTQSTSIVRAITELASNLGMSTTAEGVENAEQLARLIELGCSEAQGYFFSPPRPAADIFRGTPQVPAPVPVVA